jgi:adenine-specific DNA-methyltransferase
MRLLPRTVGGSPYDPRVLPGDSPDLRKARGAFFTPYAIAEYLVSWALRGKETEGIVLDPTCGEGVFLLAAANLTASSPGTQSPNLYGVDIHADSLDETRRLLADAGHLEPNLLVGDFFEEPNPDQLGSRIPPVDAVVGNPPFVRYHEHRGDVRRRAAAAALSQGVRLSGLASSWAALLVHASSFLKPDGRIAMVVPAELLSVGYAEPIRQWLRRRFQAVHLVLFDKLQFLDAEEQVVLLVARGSGGCSAFSLHEVSDAAELANLHIFDAEAFAPAPTGKWTEVLIPEEARAIMRGPLAERYTALGGYGTVELGTVTGANPFFTLSEATRLEYGLQEGRHVVKTLPPGSKHLHGLQFTQGQWEQLKLQGERVWMLSPSVGRPTAGSGLDRYIKLGEELKVHEGYKCSIRNPWWRAPMQPAPDMFFTYMSHVTPRLVANTAGTTFVNSLHGLTFDDWVDGELRTALPFVLLNSATMLSAELVGRAYGGGILKLEPREADQLAVPQPDVALGAWDLLEGKREYLDQLVRTRNWHQMADVVDEALLINTLGLSETDVRKLRDALARQRSRRQGRESSGGAG